jgi:hypothetical protein
MVIESQNLPTRLPREIAKRLPCLPHGIAERYLSGGRDLHQPGHKNTPHFSQQKLRSGHI